MSDPNATLEELAAVAREWKLDNLEPLTSACKSQLQTSGQIDVAVFGRFKAGKSSFLNHLVGRAVLPIGVVPVTSVITWLHYGEAQRAEVRFLNGSTKDIQLDQIVLYGSEAENPNNQKEVAEILIALPEMRSLAPLRFVDTPGVGSTLSHNTEAAIKWLPNVGAVLVAVSADAPLSEYDIDLINQLRRHTPRIALLLTKADLLTESQRVEVREFVTDQLRKKRNDIMPLFFYSIAPELAHMKSVFISDFVTPLREKRSEATAQILQHKLGSLRDHIIGYLRVALAAVSQTDSSRVTLREKLAEERRQFELFRAELNAFARDESGKSLDRSLSSLRPVLAMLDRKLTNELTQQFSNWRGRLPRLLDLWRQWLGDFLRRELSEISAVNKAIFCAPIERVETHLIRTVTGFHDRLADHVRTAFGITLAQHEFALQIREPDAPPVNVAYFDASFTAISGLIPMTLFRRSVERTLLAKAGYELEKNLVRLAAEWRDRTDVVIKELLRQAEAMARQDLAALEQMLDQSQSDLPRMLQTISKLERHPLNVS